MKQNIADYARTLRRITGQEEPTKYKNPGRYNLTGKFQPTRRELGYIKRLSTINR